MDDVTAKTPDDYVIATGVFHTVRDFVNKVAECLDMKIEGLAQD